ncbi:MAG: DUF1203 domain-containing protein [Pseudomonadota bacterium]
MNFQISALSERLFSHFYGATEEQLRKAGAQRVIADSEPGFPCRISMRDAKIGESLILLNFTHLDENTPYCASHAIFVIEGAKEQTFPKNTVPEVLRSRLLSLRAFDENYCMIAAEVCAGADLEQAITKIAADPGVAFLHVHNAAPGCYAARIDLLDNEET